jgi:hypothetical protein
MHKKFLIATLLASSACSCQLALAEDLGPGSGWSDTAENASTAPVQRPQVHVEGVDPSLPGDHPQGLAAQTGDVRHNSMPTDTHNFYLPSVTQGRMVNAPSHFTSYTKSQSALLPSQTVSSGTVIPGTHIAPGSFALMQEYGHGGELPRTTVDSISNSLGRPDDTLGDEGESGPPRATDFRTIDSGGRFHITTGHRARGLPSSWK